MDEFGKLLTLGLGLASIASLIGLSLLRGVVTGLRESLKDAREEIEDKDRRLTATQAQVQTLQTDLAALGRVVTGEAHWVAIGAKLDEHHHEASEHWKLDEQLLKEIRDRLPRSGGF